MSEPGDPGYDEMLEHQTGTEVPEEDLDPYDQEIADLGAPPGAGASARECDDYNFRLGEIEKRRALDARDERRAIEDGTAEDEAEYPEPVAIDAHTGELVTGDEAHAVA